MPATETPSVAGPAFFVVYAERGTKALLLKDWKIVRELNRSYYCAESGERLTAGRREPADVFHSQLEISPDGRRLLSVGWLWHPFGIAAAFELDQALEDIPSPIVALHPDGHRLAIAQQTGIAILQLAD